jgi:hypothetical protein
MYETIVTTLFVIIISFCFFKGGLAAQRAAVYDACDNFGVFIIDEENTISCRVIKEKK